MHVHRLISEDTFRFYCILHLKEVIFEEKSSFGRKFFPWLACVFCTGLFGISLYTHAFNPIFLEQGSYITVYKFKFNIFHFFQPSHRHSFAKFSQFVIDYSRLSPKERFKVFETTRLYIYHSYSNYPHIQYQNGNLFKG